MKKQIFAALAVVLLGFIFFLSPNKSEAIDPPTNNCPVGTTGYCVGVYDANGYACYICVDPENSAVTPNCRL
jgi:hypothetical protein